MKRSFIRSIALALAFLFITAAFSSCKEDDGSGHIFKMNIENNPRNLDPQLAQDRESLMIIQNMLEGLVRVLPDGGVVPAAAESFSMSEDGLTYTFYLKRDMKWESLADFEGNVTADDFVYAFQRLFDPETDSPYSSDYMCIKNAGAVLKGELSPNELGVRAKDEFTVEFTLEYAYHDFLQLLDRSPAMPCSKSFFEFTKGRYGMAADAVASNGAFYLKEWNFDPYWDNNYLIMRRNKSYSEKSYVYPYSLNFFITGDKSGDAEKFSKGDIDCIITEKYDEKLFKDKKVYGYAAKTAGLAFNTNSEYFRNKPLREALAKSLNRGEYSRSLPEGMTAAYGFIPSGVTIQGKSYRELVPDRTLDIYDPAFSELWENALKSAGIESVDNVKITVPDSFAGTEAVYGITDRWRSELRFNCGVEVVSDAEYAEKIESGGYDIALVEIGASRNSAYDFLKSFEETFPKYRSPAFAENLNGLKNAVSITEGIQQIKAAETLIVGDCAFVPICYEKSFLLCGGKASDVAYYPFTGTVWFGESKYFK